MQYLLSGIQLHLDNGFGITADAYYKSAEHLKTNHFEFYDSTQQAEMPQNFLYRHSIELYLKSLIIIFHKSLKINYGNVPFDSDEPEILTSGKWRKLYSCHYIDVLYNYWLNNLLIPNIEKLNQIAPKGDWQESTDISELLPIICKYDQDSSFFRYPITKNNSLDNEKYTMQKIKLQNIDKIIENTNNQEITTKKSITMLVFDNEDNLIDAYKREDYILVNVRDALNKLALYLNCMHTMTRCTLCGGH